MEILMTHFAGSYRIRILLGSQFAAIVADGVITRFLVHNSLASEGNPFLSSWVGDDMFLTLKLLGGFLAAVCLWFIYKRYPKLTIYCSSFFLVAYTFIIFWNLHILYR